MFRCGRNLYAPHICDANEVAGVDNAGVGLAHLHLAENDPHTLFLGYDIGLEAAAEARAQAARLQPLWPGNWRVYRRLEPLQRRQ